MIVSKETFDKSMNKSMMETVRMYGSKAGDLVSVTLFAASAVFTRLMSEQLYVKGMLGQLDIPASQFAVLYTQAAHTVLQDELLKNISESMVVVSAIMLTDLLIEFVLQEVHE